MAKNTFILVLALAVIAAITVGVNVSRPKQAPSSTTSPSTPSALNNESTQKSDKVQATAFESSACGVAFSYPATHEKFGDPQTNGVFFINTADENDATYVGCLKSVPKPTVPPDKIEKITVASVSATLYHDISEKSNRPINKLIFTHPKNGLEVLIVGYGRGFDQIITTLTII